MRWLKQLFMRRRHYNELSQSIQEHLEEKIADLIDVGMTRDEAGRAARREFGNASVIEERSREVWQWSMIESIWADIKFAFRQLRRSPGFTATAVLSLALGVGANTAIFGLLKQVILDLLPVRDPRQIVAISKTSLRLPGPSNSFSNPFLRDLQAAGDLPFEGFLGFGRPNGRVAMLTDSGAEPVTVEFVSGNYFDLLGVPPAVGRLFTSADDETPGGHPVVILSHNFWQRRFASDESVLNRSIHLNNHSFTLIGVSAPGFDGLDPGNSPDIWVTIGMAPELVQFPGPPPLRNRGSQWIEVFGRLNPDIGRDRAAETLMPILLRDHEIDPGRSRWTDDWKAVLASERLHVTPAAQGNAGERRAYERGIWVLSALAAAVLLLTCVNIAHLLLARTSARTQEFSVRLAIGAGKIRLVRQLLTESLLLGTLGGGAALLVAYELGQILLVLVVTDRNHSTFTVAPDRIMLAFNFAVALAASIVLGLAPALHSSRSALALGLKGKETNSEFIRRLMGRKIMMSVQVATSLVLLTGAGLFVRSLNNLRDINVGFRTDRLLQITLNPSGYAPERLGGFYAQIVEQVRSLPGVQTATFGRQRMIADDAWSSGIIVPGFTSPPNERGPYRDAIGDNYFSAMGIPLIAGREFTKADTAAAPKVAIINQAFARFYFGNQSPLGKLIGPGGGKADYTIVGVTQNAKYREMREGPTRFWYVPFAQLDDQHGFDALTLFVRTSTNPNSMVNSIRAAIQRIDRNVGLFDIKTVDAQVTDNVRLERALAYLSLFFAIVATTLAGTGLFGVLAYSVAQRRREIGIRMALGAKRDQVLLLMLDDGLRPALYGLVFGLVASVGAVRLIQSLLYGTRPLDPRIFATAAATLVAVAALACLVPAWRASRIDPMKALRTE